MSLPTSVLFPVVLVACRTNSTLSRDAFLERVKVSTLCFWDNTAVRTTLDLVYVAIVTVSFPTTTSERLKYTAVSPSGIV